jgi:diguanylate cyclase (GGDEF)-like protein
VRALVEGASFALRAWNRPRKKPAEASAKKRKKGRKPPKKLAVTVSIGLADSTVRNAEPADVLKKADEALYRAKRAGRNRVAQ